MDELAKFISALVTDDSRISFRTTDFSFPSEDYRLEEDSEETVTGFVITEVTESMTSGIRRIFVVGSGLNELSEAGSAELIRVAEDPFDSSASSTIVGFVRACTIRAINAPATYAIGL